jgi:hypothetical protein
LCKILCTITYLLIAYNIAFLCIHGQQEWPIKKSLLSIYLPNRETVFSYAIGSGLVHPNHDYSRINQMLFLLIFIIATYNWIHTDTEIQHIQYRH